MVAPIATVGASTTAPDEPTFNGSVELTGSPAEDGTSYSYELADGDEPENFSVELTGNEHRANETAQASVSNGESFSVPVGGTTPPETATATLTADWQDWMQSDSGAIQGVDTTADRVYTGSFGDEVRALDRSDGSELWSYPGLSDRVYTVEESDGTVYAGGDISGGELHALDASEGTEQWTYTGPAAEVRDLAVGSETVYAGTNSEVVHAVDASNGSEQWTYTGHSASVNGVALESGTVFTASSDQEVHAVSASDGTQQWTYTDHAAEANAITVASGTVYVAYADGAVHAIDASDGTQQWTSTPHSEGTRGITVASGTVYTTSADTTVKALDASDGSQLWTYDEFSEYGNVVALESGTVYAGGYDSELHALTPVDDPSLSIDGNTVDVTGYLEHGTEHSEAVSLSTGTHTADLTATSGTVTAAVDYEEITETVDPTVEVNGYSDTYYGTLADGETTTLDVSTAWLQEGENTVNVSASESYEGPEGQVGLDYSHSASDAHSVDYAAEAYSERYNVSKTYAYDATDSELTIPFEGNVVGVRDLELRTNGSEWSTVPDTDYRLNETTMHVDLGDVDAGTTVDVRTTGSKVRVDNGEIAVTDPTVFGNDLSSDIRIEEYSEGFEIDVGETGYNDMLHYTHSESWSNPQSYARVSEDGTQSVRFPNAGAGATATISALQLAAAPTGGHADVHVESAGDEPRFRVRETSTADSIEFVYADTTTGHVYQLYSISADVERDRGEASSPVTLEHPGTAETLAIYDLGTSGSEGGGSFGPVTTGSPGGASPPLLILIAVASLLAMYVVTRRYGDGGISSLTLFGAGSAIVAFLSVQAFAPAIVADAIGQGLSESFPLLILAGSALLIVYLRNRGEDKTINFDLGNGGN